ncbi:MAG: glutathione peroxidase [Acidobacteriota bacterium]|nr:MAG: glutathione peroxidase [Acidobacteriota bacterium]
MFKVVIVILALAAVAAAGAAYRFGFIMNPTPTEPVKESSIYDFTMKDIDGKEVKLSAFKRMALMVVNVASKCGYTSQYEQLEAVYKRFKDRGFVILGFPANNFMGQEPGTEAEIKEFCSTKYGVTFPMFSKISVTGADQHPLYGYLTNKATNPEFAGDISWNFNKFIIDRNGRVTARFASKDKPDAENVISAIESALGDAK